MRITISGPPGSGKTTVCSLLSKLSGIECVVSGAIFREMARELDLTLEEFGKLAERDDRYDRLLDEKILQIAREKGDIILEGRLAAFMLSRNGIPALKVHLDADKEERARRTSERDAVEREKASMETEERERCEAARYREYYGIDLADRSVYDLTIDTTCLTPEEVVSAIMTQMEERGWRGPS